MLSNSRSGSEILNWFSLIDNVLLFDYVVDFLGGKRDEEREEWMMFTMLEFSVLPRRQFACALIRYRRGGDTGMRKMIALIFVDR